MPPRAPHGLVEPTSAPLARTVGQSDDLPLPPRRRTRPMVARRAAEERARESTGAARGDSKEVRQSPPRCKCGIAGASAHTHSRREPSGTRPPEALGDDPHADRRQPRLLHPNATSPAMPLTRSSSVVGSHHGGGDWTDLLRPRSSFSQDLCARIRWIGNAGCKVSKRFDARTSSI